MTAHQLKTILPFLEPALIQEILQVGVIQEIPTNQVILQENTFVKMIPIVLNGLVKAYISNEEKDLLLYYIKPSESCIMSFAAGINNEKSKLNAITIENSTVLLLPSAKVKSWVKRFPNFNQIFYQQYNLRYDDLLDTIKQLIFKKLDIRLYEYLKEKSKLQQSSTIAITHQQIANELGTAREVISRVLKKLEKENKILLLNKKIEVL